MPNPHQSLFSEFRAELGALGAALREAASLRWQLARLELRADLHSIAQLTIVWLAAVILVLTTLPLGIVCLSLFLAGCGGIPTAGWLLIFTAALLVIALASGYLAWRRFCRRFVGLRETLEELREDLLWLRETSGPKKQDRS